MVIAPATGGEVGSGIGEQGFEMRVELEELVRALAVGLVSVYEHLITRLIVEVECEAGMIGGAAYVHEGLAFDGRGFDTVRGQHRIGEGEGCAPWAICVEIQVI